MWLLRIVSVRGKTGSFKRFIHAVFTCTPFFRRLEGATFGVHKNPILAFFQALLVPTWKLGVLQKCLRNRLFHMMREVDVVWYYMLQRKKLICDLTSSEDQGGCHRCWILGAVYCLLPHSLEVERPLLCTSSVVLFLACLSNLTNTRFSLHWRNGADWPWLGALHFSMHLFFVFPKLF